MPAVLATSSASAVARTRRSPTTAELPSATAKTLKTPYSMSGPYAMARLPGRVHGVVVQITMEVSSNSGVAGPETGKRTHRVVEVWSWYSTSASASAVFSTTDHITGLAPL